MTKTTAITRFTTLNQAKTKSDKPKTVSLAKFNTVRLAAPEQLVKQFSVSGYRMIPNFYGIDKFSVIVFDHTSKDKDTKQVTVTQINRVVEFTLDQFQQPTTTDKLFSGKTAKAILDKFRASLVVQPIAIMVKAGMLDPSAANTTLESVVQAEYGLDESGASELTQLYIGYLKANPTYQALSAKALVGYLTADNATGTGLLAPSDEILEDPNMVF